MSESLTRLRRIRRGPAQDAWDWEQTDWIGAAAEGLFTLTAFPARWSNLGDMTVGKVKTGRRGGGDVFQLVPSPKFRASSSPVFDIGEEKPTLWRDAHVLIVELVKQSRYSVLPMFTAP